jgi:2-dehydro-3-deoxyphosphogluconate aldolase/(4S)-4-hydroxy-2-oxoglutarate aldolase
MIINKESTLRRVREVGVLAVIRGPSPELTIQMVDALVAGGVFGIEITYSTPNAPEVVKNLDEKYGEKILLGMGTLTEPRQAAEAKGAGAHFLVSPHLDEALAQAMTSTGLLVMIGALTPSEVVRAHQLGSDVVKLFPGSLGGPAYLKALRGPFPHIPMMPTGGVSQDNIAEWLAAGAVAVGAGSNLCPTALAKEGRFVEITEIARGFVAALNQARHGK